MWALFKKEISSFLNSLIGYVVIIVFLLLNGLFIWIFPGDMNVLEMGYATLDGLFSIAPWVFMFLIPAITMRMIAEEKRNRTLELLVTRPITDFQIVISKFLAGISLVIISLIPTLVYYFCVYYIGETEGNIDRGGTLGSYLGLIFLAGGYVSMGIFSSSLSENQIVAFLLAVVMCFFMFIGWESISDFSQLGGLESYVIGIGINDHYKSVSRGLLDSRDVLYFIALIGVFLLGTITVLKSRTW
ncbi:MAG: gliding motility-associated ABC transporter permease subunit GldF [Flavobacteriales bacterium]|jgi:ABC-2 type transport system permease protein|tara:strand:+ start:5138 stop:5869 length:732 start_codon:yes stop_codon:yes gene_type:complete